MTTVEPDPDDLTPWGQHYGATRQKRGVRIAQMEDAVGESRALRSGGLPSYYKVRSQRPCIGRINYPPVPIGGYSWHNNPAVAANALRAATPAGTTKYTVIRRNGQLQCTCPDFVQLSTGARETCMDPSVMGARWCKHIWASGLWKQKPTIRDKWFPDGQRVRDIATQIAGTVVGLRDWRVLVRWDQNQQYGAHGRVFCMEYVHTDNLQRLDLNDIPIRDFEFSGRNVSRAWYSATQL